MKNKTKNDKECCKKWSLARNKSDDDLDCFHFQLLPVDAQRHLVGGPVSDTVLTCYQINLY